jgi:FAD/FMN-containing dehydrogenase/Fe-S oxidoreductase
MATDNSVYRLLPAGVVAPRSAEDVAILLKVLEEGPFRHLSITARGGGTGTNGQSLNTGIIVDFRRYMNRIVKFDFAGQWVEVEPGIVLDDLNERLAGTGLFFAPNTSTANRCTIGGMVSTDASGKGSRVYGKTSDNVLGLEMMLGGGRRLDSDRTDAGRSFLDAVAAACDEGLPGLLERLPRLSRRFTGYDVERARPSHDRIEWWRLPIGAEGTLGLVTRVRLKLLRKPSRHRLLLLAFDRFSDVLSATSALLRADPTAIEVIDDWVQQRAAKAGLLDDLPKQIRGDTDHHRVIAFVEFSGDDDVGLGAKDDACRGIAAGLQGYKASYSTTDPGQIAQLWSIRSACVGLLGAVEGSRKPISFVEDCVVPPENLAAFVADFTALLASHGVPFGIYGHADVGCLHTRPALDIHSERDRALYKEISDAVFQLATRHGGIFWGEHGKGIRGEYLEAFVGEDAYRAFRRIKAAFDPHNRFNPAKLVTLGETHLTVGGTTMRPAPPAAADAFSRAYACNGNAVCLNYDAKAAMCPSFKISGDVKHSPKGRAEAITSWHSALGRGDATPAMEEAVRDALDGCLGCKACASGCPTHIDIPELKSAFLSRYHSTRPRPLADRMTMFLEAAAPALARYRSLVRPLSNSSLLRVASLKSGIVAPPKVSAGLSSFGLGALSSGDASRRRWNDKTVFLVQDAFTALFDVPAVAATARGLELMGYEPVVIEALAGGKAAHVKGDRPRFMAQAKRLAAELRRLEATGRPLIGTDPSQVHFIRHDYPRIGLDDLPKIWSVEEFLASQLRGGRPFRNAAAGGTSATIFLHCTEQAMRPGTRADWEAVFAAIDIKVTVAQTGCCGMAGTFGHERRHQEWSKSLFSLSWASRVASASKVCATGFSCRCQVERCSPRTAIHPMRLLADAFENDPD